MSQHDGVGREAAPLGVSACRCRLSSAIRCIIACMVIAVLPCSIYDDVQVTHGKFHLELCALRSNVVAMVIT